MATFDIGIVISAFNRSKPAFASVNKSLRQTEKNANKARKGLRAIQVVLASIAIGAGAQFAKSIVKTVGEMELLIARLEQVQGGMGAARNTLNKLTNDFAGTPFSIDAVANSFTRLRAAGLGTDQAFETLAAGADAVAAFGGSTQELNRFIIGLQQSIGKGTLSMEELRQQIGEAVPSAMRVLAREMDISISELFTQIEKGAVDSLTAVKLLTKGLNDDFGGFAQTIGDKIIGTLNKARGRIRISLSELFTVDTNAAKQTVDLINRVSAGIEAFISSITQSDVDNFFEGLKNAADVIGAIIPVITRVAAEFTFLFNSVTNVIGGAGTAAAVGGLIGFLMFGGPATLVIASIIAAGVAIENITGGGKSSAFAGIAKGQDVEALKKSLQDRIILLEESRKGFFTTIGNFFGKEFTIVEDIKKLQQALKDADDPASAFFQKFAKGALEGKDAMEELTSLVDRVVATTAGKIVTLLNQAETTTFGFGSQSAEKLRRKMEPLVEVIERFRDKIDAFVAKTAGTTLTEQQSKALEGANRELVDMTKNIDKINKAIDTGEAKGLAVFAIKVADKFAKARISVNKFGAELLGGGGLDAGIQNVNDKFEKISIKIQKIIRDQEKMNDTAGIKASNAELQRAADIRDRLVVKLREQAALQEKIFALEQQSTRLQIGSDIIALQREGRSGLQQSFASSFSDQAADKQLRLKQGILEATTKIQQLELEMDGASDARRAQITATQSKLGEFINAQNQALSQTTAAGLLAQSVWKDVGDTIQTSVKQALFDVTKGTFDAERALLSFYDKITESAINYLFELIKIQFQQQLVGATASGGAGAGGGGFFSLISGFFAAANGAAVRGGITPFANGGIVRGPTMFGLAGEAGDEAILPLQRVGGQLGVRADVGGGGGDNFNVTVNAIDGPSAAAFFQKNSQLVVNAVRQETRLNNGPGAVR